MKVFTNLYLLVVIILYFASCASQSKNAESDQNNKKIPVRSTEDSIGINTIMAEGNIDITDNQYHFIVKKVLQRGRSAPVVLSGQTLKVKEPSEIIPSNSTIKAKLICPDPNDKDCFWTIIILP